MDPTPHNLAELFGLQAPSAEPPSESLLDISDPTDFCKKILQSREFRQYILVGIQTGELPPAVMCRIIDHAWGKPPERVEHTGKDGEPIVTEIRRVIVRAPHHDDDFEDEIISKTVTH